MSDTKSAPGERPEVTDKTGRTPEVFIRNLESGESAYHCGPGTDRAALRIALGNVLDSELDDAIAFGEDVDFRVEVWWMTPEEVAALPDL